MGSSFQHYLESRTSKTSSDTITQKLLGKMMDPDGDRGASIYIHGAPATGKTIFAHMVCTAVPDYAQIIYINHLPQDPKKKIIFVDDVYDGGVEIGDKVSKLVGSGYLVFILTYGEPRIPVDHTVLFERYDMGLHE